MDNLRIEILGYWGGYPSNGGATSGYLVSSDGGKILLDCGSGIMSRFSISNKVEDLSGIILSHLHYDHTTDIGIFQYALVGALRRGEIQNKLKVYSPTEPKELWKAIQSEETYFQEINENEKIQIANMTIEFLPVNHTISCYAVKVTYKHKIFVYSADTTYTDTLIEFAKNADLFICEATICKGSYHSTGAGHMSAGEAGLLAEKANVKKLILTHLPSDGDFALMKKEAKENFSKEVYVANEISIFEL
ncbi:MBL fold metallo-hydrolase [Oceanobacillus jeddahense]|uniref:MBL fold metallo-hydrolase n=1 Tax=Oceanobacillus jeddahense TaxID=1462527 RepID=UPI003B847BBD